MPKSLNRIYPHILYHIFALSGRYGHIYQHHPKALPWAMEIIGLSARLPIALKGQAHSVHSPGHSIAAPWEHRTKQHNSTCHNLLNKIYPHIMIHTFALSGREGNKHQHHPRALPWAMEIIGLSARLPNALKGHSHRVHSPGQSVATPWGTETPPTPNALKGHKYNPTTP